MKLRITDEGLVEGVRYVPSPNCDERPAGGAIELVVIHAISLPPGEFGGHGIFDLFANRLDRTAHPYYATIAERKVSSHYLIRRDGELVQFVPCAKRAWHSGESSWRGRGRCNDFSVGVELEGDERVPFTDAQYERLAALTRALEARYPIADIAGHSDVAPGRKSDPGPQFDWARYRAMLKISRQDAKDDKKTKKTKLSPRRMQRKSKNNN
ncbi:MAG: 1,6-anhydro-N-acetylmuramyl-L-alanine amidase AmpD [Betaproteobacteria bacterium]|nr:1,6-anhydro-N-acetylmuramyl-L-alanine amidase AmpD [Betaproteobacteria bacterium]